MKYLACFLLTLGLTATAPDPAKAQEAFLGEVRIMPYGFCPRGWADAGGQLLPIAQNTALFSLYGTTFGGDGRTTFGLPDLRGRVPLGIGNGPGLTPYTQGAKGGSERVTLTTPEIPAHNHVGVLNAKTSNARTTVPTDAALSDTVSNVYTTRDDFNTTLEPGSVTTENTGGGQAHETRQPFLALRFCVAVVGIFPSRN